VNRNEQRRAIDDSIFRLVFTANLTGGRKDTRYDTLDNDMLENRSTMELAKEFAIETTRRYDANLSRSDR